LSALRKHGVKKGDRVVGYIPNCAEAIEAMAATAAIGAIWSSTSPDFGVSGVLDRFSQIQPKVRISSLLSFFFGVSGVLNQFSQIQPKVRILLIFWRFWRP
jgi:acyl-coenzyme A synthetase/AMP-(fatty) acid ligase